MIVKMNIQPGLYCMTNCFIILLFSIVMMDSISMYIDFLEDTLNK
jgi:TM2 domain-containing membrane protein YozV